MIIHFEMLERIVEKFRWNVGIFLPSPRTPVKQTILIQSVEIFSRDQLAAIDNLADSSDAAHHTNLLHVAISALNVHSLELRVDSVHPGHQIFEKIFVYLREAK